MNAPDCGLARLDYFVGERLAMLRMTRGELARRGGPNRSTLHKAISGSRTVSMATLARLDASLGWAPGSAMQILDGGTPQSRVPRSAEDARVLPVLRAVDSMLDECRGLLTDVRGLVDELLNTTGGNRAG
ncbi:MAG: helix-turn-helix domain-containing protein [Mycobacteriaceae bacterium]|nr:helix-turn-helix domain-containing protein [Mycobacteriaceae bacterium]